VEIKGKTTTRNYHTWKDGSNMTGMKSEVNTGWVLLEVRVNSYTP